MSAIDGNNIFEYAFIGFLGAALLSGASGSGRSHRTLTGSEVLTRIFRTVVGTAVAGGFGAAQAALFNASSLLGRVNLWSGVLFSSAAFVVEKALWPLWHRIHSVESLPSFVKGLLKIVQFVLPRLAALGICAAVGISFTAWQAVAFVVADTVLPYLATAGLFLWWQEPLDTRSVF